MPVPIPLDEGHVTESGQLVWATGHTLFGPNRPQVGHLDFATWKFDPGEPATCQLLDPKGEVLARLVPTDRLDLPAARAQRLQSDFARHRERVSVDAVYAGRWAQGIRNARRARPRGP